MITNTILLRHLDSEEVLTAIKTYDWKESTTVDGFVTRVLQDRGWSYRESYRPIRKALAAVFEHVTESNVCDFIKEVDDVFIVLNVELTPLDETTFSP